MKVDVGFSFKCSALGEKGACSDEDLNSCEVCCLFCDSSEGCMDLCSEANFISGVHLEELKVYTDTLRPTIERVSRNKDEGGKADQQ